MQNKTQKSPPVAGVLTSALLGVSVSITLAVHFFALDSYEITDQLFLISVPAFAIAILVFTAWGYLRKAFEPAPVRMRWTLVAASGLIALLLALPLKSLALLFWIAHLVSIWGVVFGLLLPTASRLEAILTKKRWNLFSGWLLGVGLSFLVVSFLSKFFFQATQIMALSLCYILLFSVAGAFLAPRLKGILNAGLSTRWLEGVLFVLVLLFLTIIVSITRPFLQLFKVEFVWLPVRWLPLFLGSALFSAFLLLALVPYLQDRLFLRTPERSRLVTFVRENLAGLAMAGLFFLVYFFIASTLNQKQFFTDDILFDMDAATWRMRLTSDSWEDPYWRAIHPLALLILRPLVGLAALIFNGNRLYGAITLVSAAGALCVFLAWTFVRHATQAKPYALLIATLFGVTTAGLVFGSTIETYVFSAAALMLFFVFLLQEKWSLFYLVPVGVVTFGLTVTNIAQTLVGLFVFKPNIRLVVRYTALAVALGVVLSQVNNLVYPESNPFFFVPSRLLYEERHINKITFRRAEIVAREAFLYNIVAPEPLAFSEGLPTPKFWFYKRIIIRKVSMDDKLSEYEGALSTFTALVWVLLLATAGVSYLRYLFRRSSSAKISSALALVVGMNAALHLTYGKELFLYSANWTYALVLFVALSLKGLVKFRWFQIALVGFLVLVMINNARLIDFLLTTTTPFVHVAP